LSKEERLYWCKKKVLLLFKHCFWKKDKRYRDSTGAILLQVKVLPLLIEKNELFPKQAEAIRLYLIFTVSTFETIWLKF
jgi:hypothetical protein